MKIIVCIKQVPDTNDVRIDPVTGTLIRQGVPSIINPDDLHALEQALVLKDELPNVHVTVLSMGPPQALAAVREAYAMGADQAILLSDRIFAGSDTWATATILAAAVRTIGEFDIILCGRQAIDGDTAQVGPELAEFLGIPQITYVRNLRIHGHMVQVERVVEDGHMVLESPMPVLLSAIKELNSPRFPKMQLVYKAFGTEAPIHQWTNDDIHADPTQIGVKNSPTNVRKSFVPVRERFSTELVGSAQSIASELASEMRRLHIIGQ